MNKVGIGRGLVAILLVSPDVRVEDLLGREDFGIGAVAAALAIRRYQLGEAHRPENSGKESFSLLVHNFTFHKPRHDSRICLQNSLCT